jgi:hypothetical protein
VIEFAQRGAFPDNIEASECAACLWGFVQTRKYVKQRRLRVLFKLLASKPTRARAWPMNSLQIFLVHWRCSHGIVSVKLQVL